MSPAACTHTATRGCEERYGIQGPAVCQAEHTALAEAGEKHGEIDRSARGGDWYSTRFPPCARRALSGGGPGHRQIFSITAGAAGPAARHRFQRATAAFFSTASPNMNRLNATSASTAVGNGSRL